MHRVECLQSVHLCLPMSSKIESKFEEYARYCLELARQADTRERRDRLLKMAREYMQAANGKHRNSES
jgi:hypothetical protein